LGQIIFDEHFSNSARRLRRLVSQQGLAHAKAEMLTSEGKA
jgi:hypothetical protein